MCSDRTEPRNLRQILNQHPRSVGALLERAQQLSDINRSLRDWCGEPWIRHIRIANLRGDTIVIYAASATALIPLRRQSRSLLAWLETRYRLGCTRIETKVRPPQT